MKSTRVLLAKRPVGEPDDGCFQFEEREIQALKHDQILIKVLWLSLDPYMRGRMNDVKSYVEPAKIGDVMTAESAGVVVESTSTRFKAGDYVTAYTGWQTHLAIDANAPRVRTVDLRNGSLSTHLGVVGMPGRTAYFGLLAVGKPKAGETLVVAAASGAVGSVVGQMAKILGLRAIGVAGGADKCAYVKNELGFDDCIDYKAPDFEAKLAAACPKGIDVYFENVGGAVTEAVAKLLNPGSRVPICGYVSAYNAEDPSKVRNPFQILAGAKNVPEHRFFVVTEWDDRLVEATTQLGKWVKEGKIKYRESIGADIKNAPELFRGLLKGKNFGKQLVKIAEE
ncbi:MAG: NADP-dependent oxidoreductase [Candidatus Obscuribacterales bacterium]|nr:NADP-dependent oxidoreductase [Steroidobacteraceae bacterium]